MFTSGAWRTPRLLAGVQGLRKVLEPEEATSRGESARMPCGLLSRLLSARATTPSAPNETVGKMTHPGLFFFSTCFVGILLKSQGYETRGHKPSAV